MTLLALAAVVAGLGLVTMLCVRLKAPRPAPRRLVGHHHPAILRKSPR